MPKDALLDEGFTEEEVEAGIKLFEPGDGGSDCPSGYKGRAGIYQVMPISDAMKRLIIEGANAVQLADQALAEGVWAIRKSGLKKVRDGITSLAEVNRVTVD
jgi:type IV pilus assembly protein PilB